MYGHGTQPSTMQTELSRPLSFRSAAPVTDMGQLVAYARALNVTTTTETLGRDPSGGLILRSVGPPQLTAEALEGVEHHRGEQAEHANHHEGYGEDQLAYQEDVDAIEGEDHVEG